MPADASASSEKVGRRGLLFPLFLPPPLLLTPCLASPALCQTRTYPARLDSAQMEPTRLISEYLQGIGQVGARLASPPVFSPPSLSLPLPRSSCA